MLPTDPASDVGFGAACLYNQQPVNLVVDQQARFDSDPRSPGRVFAPVTPRRILDTRSGGAALLTPGTVTSVDPQLPAGTIAVINLTMTDAANTGFVTAGDCRNLRQPRPPSTSSGNHAAGTARANLALVYLDADGLFCIYNQGAVHLVVDLQGTFVTDVTAGNPLALSDSARVLDSREQLGPIRAGNVTRIRTGSDPGTNAVIANLTMADSASAGYITADRCSTLGSGSQTRSTANHTPGAPVSNLAFVSVDANGDFCIYNQRAVNLIVDIQGSFTPTGNLTMDFTDGRLLDTRCGPGYNPGTMVFSGTC